MYINIVQNTSLVENVNIKIMSKLYELMTNTDDPYDGENLLDHNSNIVGSVNISYIYDYQYNFITHEYNNCFINYRDTYLYIKDPYVKQVLLDNNFGDGIGVLMSIARSATTIPNFSGTQNNKNTDIVSFDELQYFTNVTSLYRNFQYTGDQFLSIDLRNVRNISGTFYWSGIHQVKNFQNVVSIPNQSFELANNLELLDVYGVTGLGWQSLTGTKLTELHFNDDNDIQFWETHALKNNTLLRIITGLRGTTSFKNSIFSGCSSLLELQLDSLTGDINNELCNECTSLTTFYAPNAGGTKINYRAFYNCTNLENLTLDFTNISEVSSEAFESCKSLTSFDFPNVINIGNNVFKNCTALESINISNCTSLGYQVFMNCTALESINISNCISLGYEAFMNCTALTSIDVSSANTTGYGIFNGCTNLKTITGLENLVLNNTGHRMFYNCKKLEFPELLFINSQLIGYGAFTNCNLHKVKIGSETKKIYNDGFRGCESLTEIEGLENITHIGSYIFGGCKNLEGTINLINLEGTVDNSRIYNAVQGGFQGLFLNCYKIKKVILGTIDYLNHDEFNITRHPFCHCTNLHTVDITSINSFTFGHNLFFNDCPSMTNLVLRCTNVPTIKLCGHLNSLSWSNIMSNANGKIYVPDESLNDYKSAQYWSLIADHIVSLNEYSPIED